jgi:hypothetical protein
MTPQEIDKALEQLEQESTVEHPVRARAEIAELRAQADEAYQQSKEARAAERRMRERAGDLLNKTHTLRKQARELELPLKAFERIRRMRRVHGSCCIDGHSIESMAEHLGVGKERVRQLIEQARRYARKHGALQTTPTPTEKDPLKLTQYALSVRAINCLWKARILTVGALRNHVVAHGWRSLLETPDMGPATLREIRELFYFEGAAP